MRGVRNSNCRQSRFLSALRPSTQPTSGRRVRVRRDHRLRDVFASRGQGPDVPLGPAVRSYASTREPRVGELAQHHRIEPDEDETFRRPDGRVRLHSARQRLDDGLIGRFGDFDLDYYVSLPTGGAGWPQPLPARQPLGVEATSGAVGGGKEAGRGDRATGDAPRGEEVGLSDRRSASAGAGLQRTRHVGAQGACRRAGGRSGVNDRRVEGRRDHVRQRYRARAQRPRLCDAAWRPVDGQVRAQRHGSADRVGKNPCALRIEGATMCLISSDKDLCVTFSRLVRFPPIEPDVTSLGISRTSTP